MTLLFFIMWSLSGLVGAVLTAAYCKDNEIYFKKMNPHLVRLMMLLGTLFFGPLAMLFFIYAITIGAKNG